MSRWIICTSIACACAFLCAGCGRLVSQREYLSNSMSPALSARVESMPVRTVEPYIDTNPPEGLRLPSFGDDEGDDAPDEDTSVNSDESYARSVFRQLALMHDALERLTVLAEQKGGAAVAAIDPKLRSFRTSVHMIEQYMLYLPDADDADRASLRVKIDVVLRDAGATVWEAVREVQRFHDAGYENGYIRCVAPAWL